MGNIEDDPGPSSFNLEAFNEMVEEDFVFELDAVVSFLEYRSDSKLRDRIYAFVETAAEEGHELTRAVSAVLEMVEAKYEGSRAYIGDHAAILRERANS